MPDNSADREPSRKGPERRRIVLLVFTVLAASTVGVPVIGYLSARQRMEQPLNELRDWLTQNNAAVMAVLLLVIGVTLLGKGIGGLTS